MKMAAKLNSQKGFTLTEILVTMAIMGMIATAVGSFYISSAKQTNTQLEVVDVQSNLRMVMDKLVRDIQRAGFMTSEDPIDSDLSNNTSMTINTASVTGKFARITNTVTATGTNDTFNVGDNAMVDLFNDGDSVRIIRPPLHEEPNPGIFTISALGTGTISVNGITAGTEIRPGDILVGTRVGAPLLNTVTYSIDGSRNLIRTVNGSDQIFGQNITGLDFVYEGDPIRTVQVTLTGTTDPNKTGQAGYSGLKTRTLRNHVTVRNL